MKIKPFIFFVLILFSSCSSLLEKKNKTIEPIKSNYIAEDQSNLNRPSKLEKHSPPYVVFLLLITSVGLISLAISISPKVIKKPQKQL